MARTRYAKRYGIADAAWWDAHPRLGVVGARGRGHRKLGRRLLSLGVVRWGGHGNKRRSKGWR